MDFLFDDSKTREEKKSREALKLIEKYCRWRYHDYNLASSDVDDDNECSIPDFLDHLWNDDDPAQQPKLHVFRNILSNCYHSRWFCHFKFPLEKIKQTFFKFRLHHVVVAIIVIIYSLLGGCLFSYFEAPEEIRQNEIRNTIAKQRHQTLSACFCSMKCDLWLKKFRTFSNATKLRHVHRSEESCNIEMQLMLVAYDLETGVMVQGKPVWGWSDYWNAVFYSWTLLTTIGYGNLTCHTFEGRVFTIIYALAGIPLMLISLSSIGKVMFLGVHNIWERFRQRVKKNAKRLKNHMKNHVVDKNKSNENYDEKTEFIANNSKQTLEDNIDDTAQSDVFETFPIRLALMIVFVYISVCSVIFKFWEDWDYFTSFYFFFISLSTIGLGDEIPEHPRYACAFFFFFVVGLSLVSMCVSVMQTRVENNYMTALKVVDDESRKNGVNLGLGDTAPVSPMTPSNVPQFTPPSTSLMVPTPGEVLSSSRELPTRRPSSNAVKWRRPPMRFFQLHATSGDVPQNDAVVDRPDAPSSTMHTPRSVELGSAPHSPYCRMPSTSTISRASSGVITAPPVLSALFTRRRSTMRCRRESVSRSDSLKKDLSPSGDVSWEPLLVRPPSQPRSPPPQRTSVVNTPLSVITEASDEDAREHFQKKLYGAKLFMKNTRKTSTSEKHDPSPPSTTGS